jgi:ribulose-phosphate 3-epimerase
MIAGRPIRLEVDGGITPDTAADTVQAGADTLVAGSSIFKGGTEAAYRHNLLAIRRAVAGVRGEMV